MKTTSAAKIIGLDSYRTHTDKSENLVSISDLALRLQQSIEITELLTIFCEESAKIIPCDSVRYEYHDTSGIYVPEGNRQPTINFVTGVKQDHLCKYRLVLENEELGEVFCTRKKPFSVEETNLIERLLSLLIYPLRNALLYHKALAQARKDPLTKIYNRSAFDEAIDKELVSYRRHQVDFSLMIIDIDYFKRVNDNHGHLVGDVVLKAVAESIRNTIRRSDEVYRYGGEEFVVILSNTQQGGARFIAERVRKSIERLSVNLEQNIQVTASIGIASSERMDDVAAILDQADKALYQAKDQGRNRVISSNNSPVCLEAESV